MIRQCIFCNVIQQVDSVAKIYEDNQVFCFLDRRPLFHGHCLLIPKGHYETLSDLPNSLLEPFFGKVKQMAVVVQVGMEAEGSFVAMNNIVSQSVPHLHVHIVPRRKGDKLKGFFWPRCHYDGNELATTQQKLIATWEKLYGKHLA